MNPPIVDGPWLRPSGAFPAEPRWGHPHGLQLGLAPLPGPRGLLRVYAPYLGQPRDVVINFIAIEPTPAGTRERGYSELEPSRLDPQPGKRFWSADSSPGPAAVGDPTRPSRGVVEMVDGVPALTVHIGIERFDNGAEVYARVRFLAGQPHAVRIAVFASPLSEPLSSVAVTATMGNYARLRRLHLAGRIVTPTSLWPAFQGDGFTDHARFTLAELPRGVDGSAVLAASPDEADPSRARYADATMPHWHYVGRPAVQRWLAADPAPGLAALVNGRRTYWASQSPIPGGIAFENVEFTEAFRSGQEYTFAVDPL
jgi:hypothetical protein